MRVSHRYSRPATAAVVFEWHPYRYLGVLNRHESLAANLGAKLTGPRLLKAMEGVFEGSITTTPPQTPFTANAVSWIDILQFSKTNPNDFVLCTTMEGLRVSRFYLNGVQVEISEDDWRIINSGALDSFRVGASAQPLEEDESVELATLEIVEGRLQALIKKADEVAKRARQLNYQLGGRKAAINSRRQAQHSFQAVNQHSSRGMGTAPNYDLHADLLQQFSAHTHLTRSRASSSAAALSQSPATPYGMPGVKALPSQHRVVPSGRGPLAASAAAQDLAKIDLLTQQAMADDPTGRHRPLMTARIEKLDKGDVIFPPCDRCRRLKTHCVKHLTACQGCTKKHAKCGWKTATDEEIARVRHDMALAGETEPPELLSVTDGDYAAEAGRLAPLRLAMREDPSTAADGSRSSSSAELQNRPGSATGYGGGLGESRRRGDAYMDLDASHESRGSEQDGQPGGSSHTAESHSLLSQMALMASARADARDARDGLDTGSTPSNTPRR